MNTTHDFVWPSDRARAESDELNRVCEYLEEVLDHIPDATKLAGQVPGYIPMDSEVIQRLQREHDALEAKVEKLCRFIGSPRHSELTIVQRELLVAQYHAMRSYLVILKFRISDLLSPAAAGKTVDEVLEGGGGGQSEKG